MMLNFNILSTVAYIINNVIVVDAVVTAKIMHKWLFFNT